VRFIPCSSHSRASRRRPTAGWPAPGLLAWLSWYGEVLRYESGDCAVCATPSRRARWTKLPPTARGVPRPSLLRERALPGCSFVAVLPCVFPCPLDAVRQRNVTTPLRLRRRCGLGRGGGSPRIRHLNGEQRRKWAHGPKEALELPPALSIPPLATGKPWSTLRHGTSCGRRPIRASL
jgi:hypothetical protein